MIVVDILVERIANSLNRPFSYAFDLDDDIKIGVRVIVEFNNKDIVGYVVSVNKDELTYEEKCEELGFKLNKVKAVLDKEAIINDDLMELVDVLANYYLCPKIAILQTMLPPSLKPKLSSMKSAKISYDQYLIIKDYKEDNLTDKQIEILRLIKDNKQVLKKDIKSPSVINKLIEKSLIEIKYVEKNRYNHEIKNFYKPNKLTSMQLDAFNKIVSTDKYVSLLEGVTGSGKSEVYLSLASYYIKNNKNIIMLVPEISLTPMMIDMFLSRFKDKVAVLHSDLTPAEKYDEYRRILKGEVNIVVGARSAIFAPLKNIGLIILDEEHVESYKQDTTPYYHAREVALIRAKMHNAKVVLGSATPTLETRAKAIKGIYEHVIMDKRINEYELPKTYIVDMLKSYNQNTNSSMFSNILIDKINDRLSKKEQVVLLINRRGYSSNLTCRECGHYFKCPECGVALTYHRQDNMLKCHHCDYVNSVPHVCPECGSKKIFRTGFGTERIEEEVHKLFPSARVLRLDSDVGKVRNKVSTILNQFRNYEADILIGTQMIAKGHDFKNVTLVGIVLADIGLTIPSFRSSERAFQLITQAVGRSGRGDKQGEAIIQTYLADNYAINFAAKQDYNNFFKREMHNRLLTKYPPFSHLISLKIFAKDEEKCVLLSEKIATDLKLSSFDNVTVLGPTTPYIEFDKGYHVRFIIIKYLKNEGVKEYLNNLLKSTQRKSDIKISIDIDPYDF